MFNYRHDVWMMDPGLDLYLAGESLSEFFFLLCVCHLWVKRLSRQPSPFPVLNLMYDPESAAIY
jgi:hypothetical protein